MKSRASWLLLLVLPLPALLAARAGARGPLEVRLNLGPGDGPYVTGAASGYDIQDGTALQWSGTRSRIALPLALEGPAELWMRFGPPRGETHESTSRLPADPSSRSSVASVRPTRSTGRRWQLPCPLPWSSISR